MQRYKVPSVSFVSIILAASALVATGCKQDEGTSQTGAASEQQPAKAVQAPAGETAPAEIPEASPVPAQLAGLPGTPSPEHNLTNPEKVALGERLFFDKRLSDSGNFACVTCHLPEKGWTDGLPLSTKANGQVNKRHSPSLYNVAYATAWYWDGRKATLEDQILAAWTGQMGGTPEKVAETLAAVPEYATRFQRAFGEAPTPDNIPKALGSFVRIGLRSGDAPWDRYQAGDKSAVSEDAVAGYEVFTKKAGCAACHAPPLFTDMSYHNAGVGYEGNDSPDVGRFAVTKVARDTGAFKTPGLRSVTLTAPYFHDGSAATLEEAVDFMLAGGYREGNEHIDPLLKPVKLSEEERAQLLAFIAALTPEQRYTPPALP